MPNINLNNTLACVTIKGIDATTFLQGQFTNDVNHLKQHETQLSANLNNKGRVFANFWLTKENDTYILITTHSIMDKLISRLKMYVLRSKVEFEKLTTNIIFTDNIQSMDNNLVILKIELPNNHYLVLTSEDIVIQDTSFWKLFLINHGIPQIYPETQEQLIPQHINFDELNGLNFKKGCYIGQEIVARMHYLGRSKRKMFRFLSDYELSIGQTVFSPKLNNQEVGIIVDIVKREVNYIGLVALQTDCHDSVYIDKENQKPILIQTIDYTRNNLDE